MWRITVFIAVAFLACIDACEDKNYNYCTHFLGDGTAKYLCYDVRLRDNCCRSCESLRSYIAGCEWGDAIKECQGYIETYGGLSCYPPAYEEQCCETCKRLIIPGQPDYCRYGDRVRNCDSIVLPTNYEKRCKTHSNDCCLTCSKYGYTGK